MSEKKTDWKRLIIWLIIFKIGYFVMVSGAVWLWSDFNETRSKFIKSIWFDPSDARWLENQETFLSRHFATWDAEHYLVLSETGYSKGLRSCAFYPLWPLLIRGFSVFTGGNHLIAGMLLANLLSLSGWALFYHVTSKRFGERIARLALVFLIIFPGSLFYQFIYSESLFFLLIMLLWFSLERNQQGLGAIAAVLLPLSRAVGVFTLLPIAWDWLIRCEWRWIKCRKWLVVERGRVASEFLVPAGSRLRNGLVLLAAPFFGLGLYFSLMWGWTGNPFEGIEAQKLWGVHSIENLWNIPKLIAGLIDPTTWHEMRGSVLDRCAFVLLLFVIPVILRLGTDLIMWSLALGILPAMSGTFVSFSRFESTVFPLFIGLAFLFTRLKTRWPLVGVFVSFSILHFILLWRYLNFRWAG